MIRLHSNIKCEKYQIRCDYATEEREPDHLILEVKQDVAQRPPADSASCAQNRGAHKGRELVSINSHRAPRQIQIQIFQTLDTT